MRTNILSLYLLLMVNLALAQVNVKIDPTADAKPVSPYLYGRNNSLTGDPGKVSSINWTMLKDAGVMMFRENGGNNATKYNWRKKISSHPDWYNNVYANDWDVAAKALKDNIPSAQGMWGFQLIGKAAMTNKANFDDWGYNKSHWWEGTAQNLAGGGTPNKTGAKAALEGNTNLYLENWPADSTVGIIDHWFGKNGIGLDKTKVQYWNMDNEAEIWNGTHDDLFSTQPTAEDFMQKYFAVAKKARAAYPNIKLVGPVTANEWQWYRWGSANIMVGGKNYPWLEFFIKRIAEEQKATGIKLLDVLDIHFYPSSKTASEVVQYHRIFFDRNYNYPEANGLRTINGGYDNAQTKEYVFGRCNDWLNQYLGANHGVKLGLTEAGIQLTDPSSVAVWYASTLGEFIKNDVEIFTPWDWKTGMWETLHLFSRYNQKTSVRGLSSEEEFVSAYPTVNAAKDSLTIVLVNRSTTTAKSTTLGFDNFVVGSSNAKVLTIKNLPTSETFVSHNQNAAVASTVPVFDNLITISLAPLSIVSVQITGKVGAYIANVTAIEPPNSANELSIFPNPNQNYLEVNMDGKIQIFDLTGREIKTTQQGRSLKTDHLSSGTYLLKMTTKNGEVLTRKFIKN